MRTEDVKTVAMYGPSISDPSKQVNRDVPVCDTQAYKAAGYKLGSIVEEVEVVLGLAKTPAESLVEAPKAKGKKK